MLSQFLLGGIFIIFLIIIIVTVWRSREEEQTSSEEITVPTTEEAIYIYREPSEPYPVIDYCAEYEETDTNISFECHRQVWYEAGCIASAEFFRSGHEEGGWPTQQTLANLRQDKINWYNNAVAGITEPWDYSETCFGYPAGTF